MNSKQAKKKRREREQAKRALVIELAVWRSHGDKDEALKIAKELMQLDIDQLLHYAEYMLMRNSPLRRMVR